MSDAGTDARTELSGQELAAYRARREALLAAVTDLDDEVTALEAQGELELARLRAAVAAATASFAQHVEEAESTDGLLARITDEAPWLAVRVTRLRDEHETLHLALAQLEGRLHDGEDDPTELLRQARAMVRQLSTHRHRGTELLLDAFSLDLSSGE